MKKVLLGSLQEAPLDASRPFCRVHIRYADGSGHTTHPATEQVDWKHVEAYEQRAAEPTLGSLVAALEHDRRLNDEAAELQTALNNSSLASRKESLRREIARKYLEIGAFRATSLKELT